MISGCSVSCKDASEQLCRLCSESFTDCLRPSVWASKKLGTASGGSSAGYCHKGNESLHQILLQLSKLLTAATSQQRFRWLVLKLVVHVLPGVPCERFAREAGAPACKVNKLRWCQTDLGSYALRWPRLMREARRFGNMATECDPEGLLSRLHMIHSLCLANFRSRPRSRCMLMYCKEVGRPSVEIRQSSSPMALNVLRGQQTAPGSALRSPVLQGQRSVG